MSATKKLFTDATLNIKFDNTSKQHRADIRAVVKAGADIIGLQEVQTPAARNAVRRWLLFHPGWKMIPGGECPILFKRKVFSSKLHHVQEIDPGLAQVNPQRVVNEIVLTVKAAKEYILHYANTHIEHQYTHNHIHSDHYAYKEKAAKRGLDYVASRIFDRHGGDYNALINNHDEPWYPWRFKTDYMIKNNGLDYICYDNPYFLRNATVLHELNTDHSAILVEVWA